MEIIYNIGTFATVILFFGFILGLLRPKWVGQETRGGVLKIYGLGTLLFTIVFSSLEPDPEPGEAAEVAIVEEVVPAEPEPEVEVTPEERLRARILEAIGPSDRGVTRVEEVAMHGDELVIVWAINEMLTNAAIAREAQRNATEILKLVTTSSGLSVASVRLRGTFAMVDQLGNTREAVIVHTTYSPATLLRINWDGFQPANVFNEGIAETATLHPAFANAFR